MKDKPRRRADDPLLARVRKICLALPAATEKIAWGEPTFRVKDKLFVMYASADNHHGSGRPALWIKSTLDNQAMMIATQPDRYYRPAYVGPSGWVAVWLDKRPPWREIADLVEDAWRMTAPKKLIATLG